MTAEEHTAKASITNVPISTRQAVEICSAIRGKEMQQAKAFLNRVLVKEEAVPFKRHKMNMGHKPGNIAAGRYPHKASTMILSLLNAVQSNAEDKGLDAEKLYVHTIMANQGSRGFRVGRRRGIKARNTHVCIVVAEREREEQQQKKEIQQKKAPEKQKEQIVSKEKTHVTQPAAQASQSQQQKKVTKQ